MQERQETPDGSSDAGDFKPYVPASDSPRELTWPAIVVGAFSSALVIGSVLKALNDAGTVYSKKPENLPAVQVDLKSLSGGKERARTRGGEADTTEYNVWNVQAGNAQNVSSGKYLVDDAGRVVYLVDPAINGRLKTWDDGTPVTKFSAPKTQLMFFIIDGVLGKTLPWDLVLLGILIALTLELCRIAALPFAVGIYLPLESSAPIFFGGLVRWLVDKYWRARTGQGEPDSGPGVLLSSGYIAGGTIAGVVGAFLQFSDRLPSVLDLEANSAFLKEHSVGLATVAFVVIAILLFLVGIGKVFPDPLALGERKK